MACNLIAMACNLIAMASNLIAMASNLQAMASNLIANKHQAKANGSNLPIQAQPPQQFHSIPSSFSVTHPFYVKSSEIHVYVAHVCTHHPKNFTTDLFNLEKVLPSDLGLFVDCKCTTYFSVAYQLGLFKKQAKWDRS